MKRQVRCDVFDYKKKMKLKEGEWVDIIVEQEDLFIVEKKNLQRVSVRKEFVK